MSIKKIKLYRRVQSKKRSHSIIVISNSRDKPLLTINSPYLIFITNQTYMDMCAHTCIHTYIRLFYNLLFKTNVNIILSLSKRPCK